MKYIVLALLLVGCAQAPKQEKSKLDETVDSLIAQSQRNTDSASIALTKTDSAVVEKVEKTVQKIGNLETENKQLKEENHALKTKLINIKRTSKPYKLLPVSAD